MEPAEAVLRFLHGVGPGSEAEFYLHLFRQRAKESFAAIVVDPATMRDNANGVALDLRLLSSLSLTPIVVLGFYAPEQADNETARLTKKLAEMDVASTSHWIGAAPKSIAAVTERGAVPILRMRGVDQDARVAELAATLTGLATHKLIFLRSEGGLRDTLHDGQPLSVVNLSDDFGELMASNELSDAQKSLLEVSRKLVLELVTHEMLVTLASPINLLYELFTVKGAGTLLRRGARIERHASIAEVDRGALEGLLTSSFGKPPSAAVFERPYSSVYVEERYRGAALVAPAPLGAYLSKFAVTREAQGEGVGRDLWQAMTNEHHVLVWRARATNPIRGWYEKQCDGRVRENGWSIFWKNLPAERIGDAIAFARAQPVDF